jgi:cobalt-zinc-cadmium efflux system membrane fusion protein
MSIALPNRSTIRGVLPWVVLGLGLLLLAVNLTLHDALFHRGRAAVSSAENPGDAPAPLGASARAIPTTVTLAEGKLKAAAIATEKATLVSLPAELGVPGRIEANLDHQVPIRPRAAGVIRSVGVKKGDVLATMDSPDVGTARLNLRAKQRELATVRFEAEWKNQVATNVAALIPELRRRTEANVIERLYADRPLGSFRALLLSAYAKFDIAYHEEEKTTGLRREMIVGEHPVYVAKHTREAAQAEFEAVLEQAKFDANQQSRVANQQVRMAEGEVIDAAQRLRILGVSEDIDNLLANADQGSLTKLAQEDVTAYPTIAPFDGTIITKSAVLSQKAEVNDVLFTLADLSTVWVMVNIPESDFALLPALNASKIRLTATAYPDRQFEARLLSVGATVDTTTRTVPMLAETANADGILKVGMFVRIVLDTAIDAQVVTIPTAAVVEIEGKKGVFVPDAKDVHTFHFRPLKLGRASGDRQVVVSGLAVIDEVVSKGAFILKSELVLQNETEEE